LHTARLSSPVKYHTCVLSWLDNRQSDTSHVIYSETLQPDIPVVPFLMVIFPYSLILFSFSFLILSSLSPTLLQHITLYCCNLISYSPLLHSSILHPSIPLLYNHIPYPLHPLYYSQSPTAVFPRAIYSLCPILHPLSLSLSPPIS
jgi:hypothetical protein